MTSTSSDPVVLRDVPADRLGTRPAAGDLRTGRWTRFGSSAVLGDDATEAALGSLVDAAGSAARAQGYAMGWAEGRRAALARADADREQRARAHDAEHAEAVAEVARTADALARAADRLHAENSAHVNALAEAAVDLALQVAEAVLGRELLVTADPGGDALRRALAAVPEPGPVTVRLNPDDLAALGPGALEDRVAVRADPTLARGDAVAETGTCSVDATVAAALARVREVLLP
jgi:flagellar assembly protein FliH